MSRPAFASDETLAGAVRAAYLNSPRLAQQGAAQRILEEARTQARAGWRPALSGQALIQDNHVDLGASQEPEYVADSTGHLQLVNPGQAYAYNSGSATIQASIPLYTGGRVLSAVRAADADVQAGGQLLRADEIDLVLTVIEAYESLSVATQVLKTRSDGVAFGVKQTEQAEAKLRLGQSNIVEFAQAQAQEAESRSLLETARSEVSDWRLTLIALIGYSIGSPAPEFALPPVPRSVSDALAVAELSNPRLRKCKLDATAAHSRVAEARASKNVSVAANISLGYVGSVSPFQAGLYDRNIQAGISVSQSFYSGGTISSQVRQAVAREEVARITIEVVRRDLVRDVAIQWNRIEAADRALALRSAQATAARVASEGAGEQYKFGTTSLIDSLLLEQKHREAEIAKVQAERDLLLAKARLLALTGQLTASSICPDLESRPAAVKPSRLGTSASEALELVPRTLDSALGQGR